MLQIITLSFGTASFDQTHTFGKTNPPQNEIGRARKTDNGRRKNIHALKKTKLEEC